MAKECSGKASTAVSGIGGAPAPDSPSTRGRAPRLMVEGINLPGYAVFDGQAAGTPGSAPAQVEVPVSDEVTGAGLPALFEQLYSSVKAGRSKYHGSPVNIGMGRSDGTEILC
jgi:hypothetical protein